MSILRISDPAFRRSLRLVTVAVLVGIAVAACSDDDGAGRADETPSTEASGPLDADSLAELVQATRDDSSRYSCAEEVTSPGGVDYCVGGDRGADRTVLLVGDARARQWKEALSTAAQDVEIQLLDRWLGVCPVIEVNVPRDTVEEEDRCDEHREGTWELIDELRPDAVVVAQSHAYPRLTDEAGVALDAETRAEAWEEALQSFLAELESSGVSAGMILDNPMNPEDPLDCLEREGEAAGCERTLAELHVDAEPYRDIDLAVAADSGVPIVDATELVCDSERCALVTGRVLVYETRGQLTEAFTLLHVDALRALLDGLVD
jgi:hypothetical protein